MTLWERKGDDLVDPEADVERRRALPPRRCTGGYDDAGRFGHDGDTCPVHEAGDAYETSDPKHPDHHDIFSAIADDR
jgi:hypothetical protein